MKKTLFERSYDYLVKQGCTIWEGKDKQTDPINYPKNLGNYKYIVIMDGDTTPILTTNYKKDVIQLAKDLKKDLSCE